MHHACLCYAYLPTPDVWRFVNKAGEEVHCAAERATAGPTMPTLLRRRCFAGLGLAVQPDFVVGEAIEDGRLEAVMPDWPRRRSRSISSCRPGAQGRRGSKRLAAFLTERLGCLSRGYWLRSSLKLDAAFDFRRDRGRYSARWG